MWSRTGYGEGIHLTWGSPPVLSFQLPEMILIRVDEENPKQVEGQRVADSRVVLIKSEPMKPGNSVEDKTLMTGRCVLRLGDERKSARGSRGRKTMVTAGMSRQRVMAEGNQQTDQGTPKDTTSPSATKDLQED